MSGLYALSTARCELSSRHLYPTFVPRSLYFDFLSVFFLSHSLYLSLCSPTFFPLFAFRLSSIPS